MEHTATRFVVADLIKDANSIGIEIEHMSSVYEFAQAVRAASERGPSYPSKSDFVSYNMYGDGKVIALNVKGDELCKLKTEHPKAVIEAVTVDEKYRIGLGAYNEYHQIVNSVFYQGLIFIEGLMDNPKASALYLKAYERGHSAGYEEVAGVFVDLKDLIV